MLEATDLDKLAKDLRPLLVPGANLPFNSRRLISDPVSNATAMLVHFPAGWSRAAGYYSCTEHAVLLDGTLEIDGFECRPGAGFVIPAQATRWAARSSGALAIAWFSDLQIWRSVSDEGQSDVEKVCSVKDWTGDQPGRVFDVVDPKMRTWLHWDSASTMQTELALKGVANGSLIYRWNV